MNRRRRYTGSNPSLRRVLYRAHLGVALVAVFTAGLAVTLVGLLTLRAYADPNQQLIARSISYTVEAAVVFGDAQAAEESLALIASSEEVSSAIVYDRQAAPASWHRESTGPLHLLEQQLAHWLLSAPTEQPILHDGQKIGSVEVKGSGGSLLRFLLTGFAGMVLCLLLTALGAFYLSRRLVRGIVGPLDQLAKVAHTVRRERDFEKRVPEAGIAELSQLGEDFNALLDELESWQARLQDENASLAHQAHHDSLTSLPNRAFFEGRLSRALRDASEHREQLAVLFIDSDRFKEINDRLGHAAGDTVLVNIAMRIRGQLRESDLVARLGGDEFAVLLAPLASGADALRIADNIIASMQAPIRLSDGSTVSTSLTIGIALYPEHADTPAALLHDADMAMYIAKRQARGSRRLAELNDPASFRKKGDRQCYPRGSTQVDCSPSPCSALCWAWPVARPPPQTGLSAEQIAVLQEQGFELRDEGWEFGMSSKVLFGNNLDRLNPDSRNTLTKIAHALLAVDIDKVRLEGHTDNYGDEGYNQKLSERRAESVAAVFREAGMPAANIEVRGLGMSKPVADNKTRAGRSENRRVAIIVPAE